MMSFRSDSAKVALLVCLSAAFAVSLMASAQVVTGSSNAGAAAAESQNSGELQEVVVTAQRRSEKLQDVPISVAAFSATQLEAALVSGTSDLPALTPGLVFGSQADTAQPFLRGVGTVAIAPGIENPVALYVDNVYYGAAAAGVMAFNSVEQVEVDKGPQGTLFGRNATGGLIQVTTKDPSHTFGGSVSATYGDYATAGTDLYVTGGLTDSVAADFAAHFLHQGDGFGENVVTGQQVAKIQDVAARSKWLIDAADGTKITLIFDYDVTHFIPNYTAAPGTTALGAPSTPLSSQDVAGIYQPFGDARQGGVSVNVQHDFDFARLLSITAYRYSDLAVQGAAQLAANPEFGVSSIAYLKNEQITQEFQALSLPNSRINWAAGTYLYADDAGYTPTLVTTGGLIAPLDYVDIFDHQKAYSAAVYGQATTEVAPATNLPTTVSFRRSNSRPKCSMPTQSARKQPCSIVISA
jgi:iron complex outermembrane recepter protein